jgi:hypothetical protein
MTPFPYYIIHSARQVLSEAYATRPPYYNGYRGWTPPGTPTRLAAPSTLPQTLPRADWAKEITALGVHNLKDACGLPAKDQNGMPYCWAYGSVRAIEVSRIARGLKPLDLCPESVAGPCTGWRLEGGYAEEAFAQIDAHGVCESRLVREPHRLEPRLWDPSWQENAKSHECHRWYRITDADRIPNYDEVVTCLLNRQPVAIGLPWWGHLICALAAIILPPDTDCPVNTPTGDKVGILIQNSWGQDWPWANANGYAVLVESLGTPDGAASPIFAD